MTKQTNESIKSLSYDIELTLCCNGSFEEAFRHSEQRPVGVQGVDGWRRLQQLCIRIHLWNLQDKGSSVSHLATRFKDNSLMLQLNM